jgi:hypothetical protein
MTTESRSTIFTPAILSALTATAIVAYAVHSTAWIAHEVEGGPWRRWLELIYLVSLFVWMPAFVIALFGKARLQKTTPPIVIEDERTGIVFAHAHQVALVIVLCVQIPFFFITVPTNVLAQLTVTTCVVALFASYAWFDR